ncbi:MAG TPA: SoxR reducing system RseC family protein [Spirochaetota bacterium]|nr:SoxR reducing system RseC family protein [Spirochaetota bacterium]HPJ34998.1 SoxR reducing system RseC family protein [Spirochaetota bacterium]
MQYDIQSARDDNLQEGFILRLDGEFAKIRVSGHADCDNCQSCDVANMEIVAYNFVQAAVGQKVRFLMVEDSMIKISVMLFLFPLLSIFTGLYAGSLLAALLNFNQTALMTIGAFLFLSVAIVIIYFYDKRYKLNKSNFPQVIEVIE